MSAPVPWLHIRAFGTPVPQGSKKAWADPTAPNGVRMVEDQGERHANWRRAVTAAATEALWRAKVKEPSEEPLSVLLTFMFFRGAGHYGTGKTTSHLVKDSAPAFPYRRPDLDKLVRAVFDSLTDARVWVDDAQVCAFTARKKFIDRFEGEPEGVEVVVGVLE